MSDLKGLIFILAIAISIAITSTVYAYDNVLSNGKFNSTKAWSLVNSLGRPIKCGDISPPNYYKENLQASYDNLSALYDILINVNNNHSVFGLYDDLPDSYYTALGGTLDFMYKKMDDIRTEIYKPKAGDPVPEAGLNCAGFNMAYQIYKGYKEANETAPKS